MKPNSHTVKTNEPAVDFSASTYGGTAFSQYELDEFTYETFGDSASNGGNVVNAIGEGVQAGLIALAEGGTEAQIDQAIVNAVTTACGAIVPAEEIAGSITNVTSGIAASVSGNQIVLINIANNTPYTLEFSDDSSNDQWYNNHGEMLGYPSTIAKINPPVINAGCYVFSSGAALYGPSGAVWMSIMDGGNLLAGLNVAYSNPASGSSNNCAVSFNETLSSWFDSFNSQSPQTQSIASVADSSGQIFYATASMAPASSWPLTINVVLSVVNSRVVNGDPVLGVMNANQMKCAFVDALYNVWSISDCNGTYDPYIVVVSGDYPGMEAIVNDVQPVEYNGATHYLMTDASRNVWDVVPGVSATATNTGYAGSFTRPYGVLNGADLHVCYCDSSGNIWDCYTSGNGYSVQQLAGTGDDALTDGPLSASNAVPLVLPIAGGGNSYHVFYFDASGNLWDVNYNFNDNDVWAATQLTGTGGATTAPVGGGVPAPLLIQAGAMLSVGYIDLNGNVWQLYYNDNWESQQINGTNGLAGGPTAAIGTSPALLCVGDGWPIYYFYFDSNGYMHAAYQATTDPIWSTSQLTGTGGITSGPTGMGQIAVTYFQSEPRVYYADNVYGNLWLVYGNASSWALFAL